MRTKSTKSETRLRGITMDRLAQVRGGDGELVAGATAEEEARKQLGKVKWEEIRVEPTQL